MTMEKHFVNAAYIILVYVCRHFRSSYTFHYHSPTLRMESVVFYKIAVNISHVTRRHTAEITSLQNFLF